jgi:hypothetical protein
MTGSLALPRLRGPGLGWVPAVWRRPATWLTVWRFVWAGPLIGCLPYAWMVISVPVAYAVGAAPAAVAGLLFAAWYHGQHGRTPTWPWRATVGALAGLGAAAALALVMLLGSQQLEWFPVGIVAAHGVPAGIVLALLQKPVSQLAQSAS